MLLDKDNMTKTNTKNDVLKANATRQFDNSKKEGKDQKLFKLTFYLVLQHVAQTK